MEKIDDSLRIIQKLNDKDLIKKVVALKDGKSALKNLADSINKVLNDIKKTEIRI